MVLVIFILRECELLDPPLRPPLRLLGLHQAAVLVVKLGLKILQAVVKTCLLS